MKKLLYNQKIPVYFLDIETLGFEHENNQVKLIVVYDLLLDDYYIWDLQTHGSDFVEKCCDFIFSTKGIFMAHNGSNFDFKILGLLNHIVGIPLTKGTRILTAYISKNLTISRGKNKGKYKNKSSTAIVDSLTFLPCSLKKTDKKKDFDFKKMTSYDTNPEIRAECIDYCKNDCKLIADYFANFVKVTNTKVDTINKIFTFGSMCYNKYKTENSEIYKFKEREDNLIRDYYRGGIVHYKEINEFFDVTSVDINCAYPTVMCHDLPESNPLTYIVNGTYRPKIKPINSISDLLKDLNIFVEFYADFNDPFYPIAFEHENLYAPSGRFHVKSTLAELNLAIAFGKVSNIYILKKIVFTKTINMKSFMLENYNKRLQAKKDNDLIESATRKTLMASVYGYQGMNPDYHVTLEPMPLHIKSVADAGDIKNPPLYKGGSRIRFLDKRLFWVTEPKKKSYKNIAFAAAATSGCRCLLKYLIYCNPNFLYCDTDCIHVQGQINTGFIKIGHSLGDVKIEEENQVAYYVGRKSYAFPNSRTKTKPVTKGVKIDMNSFLEVAKGIKKEVRSEDIAAIRAYGNGQFVVNKYKRYFKITDVNKKIPKLLKSKLNLNNK